MKRKLLLLVPVLFMAACGAGAASSAGVNSVHTANGAGFVPAMQPAAPLPNGARASASAGGAANGAAGDQLTAPPLPSAQHLELAATLGIQMPHGKFDQGLDTILGIISTEGGYLASSSTASGSGGTPDSGTFSFQVPANKYQDTLDQLRGVGKFTSQQSTSKPHDSEYVDLQARLQSANLQLAALNALLTRATSIGDIIAIEQQVAPVQQDIEQIKGQLQYLDSLTQYSTITVNLTEKGVAPAPRPVADQWGFAAAVEQALHNLAAILNGFIVVLGTLLPFIALAVIALVTRRRWLPAFART